MKTKSLLTVIMLLTTWTGFAQSDLFDKLSDHKDITQVTVTKGLLSMVPDMASSMKMNGVDIKNITSKLEQIDIFTSKQKDAKQLMKKEVSAYLKGNKSYEVLMKIKEENENVSFYAQKDGDLIKSLLMFVDGDNECVVIRLLGKFKTEDVQKIIKKQ
ncbi:MAG: DUF4252 domain-containing protein [Dysgonamonadaceae bacterium]|jgi:hypothetical protein|nr:DUF4252 domain-containing protein [Dysgonamonadaceae bacterium]